MLKYPVFLIITFIIFPLTIFAQKGKKESKKLSSNRETIQKKNIKFGVASFYAKKFNGRKTANDEIYRDEKYTAACNQLPLNTWIKVTNLKNKRWVIVRINDRLNSHNKRLVDLSRSAAQKLRIIARGIAKVKVEVLKNYSLNK